MSEKNCLTEMPQISDAESCIDNSGEDVIADNNSEALNSKEDNSDNISENGEDNNSNEFELNSFDDVQDDELVEENKKKRVKIIISVVVAAVVFGIVATIGIVQYQKKKAEEAYAARLHSYSANMQEAASLMLKGAADAEECGNLVKKVWYNAIYEERDSETDPYTTEDGRWFVDDFNEALANLFASSTYKLSKSKIEKNTEDVNSLMKKLLNPPTEYSAAYDKLSELYDAYSSLTECALNPSGSLKSYSSTFNDADSAVLKCFKAVQLYFDN